MKIIFATGNKGKLREAGEILGDGFELATPYEMGMEEDIPETGNTLRANSLQKAEYLFEKLGLDCFADDTGLEVDALGGAPGVYTARYAGEGKDWDANMDKVLAELSRVRAEMCSAASMGLSMRTFTRRARFKSVITLIIKGEKHFFEGKLEGNIALAKAGCGGFGYDPIFIPLDSELEALREKYGEDIVGRLSGLTLSEISEEQKNAISHRGKALRAMAEFLKKD